MSNRVLDTDSIVVSAEIASGTAGLVDDGLRQRVDKLAAYFRNQPGMTQAHAEATRRQIVSILHRRLCIANDVARHPEILDEPVDNPIFVVGFGRTGTTLLQSLLGSDPANRAVTALNTREPSPPPGEVPVTQYRRDRASLDIAGFVERCTGILPFHPYFDNGGDAVIEDEEIFTLDFRNAYPSLLFEAPSLVIDISVDDSVAAYRFLKLFMQHQQWHRPKRRWVMKGVEHQRQLPALFEVFPDAKCIWAHRDPDSFVPSILAMAAVIYDGIAGGGLDRHVLAQGFLIPFKEEIDRILTDPSTSDPRVLHVAYQRLVADPVAVLRDAYGRWGLDFSGATEGAMRGWLADDANRSDRYGRYKYDYAPFGLDPVEESRRYDAYRARFAHELSAGAAE